MKYNGIVVSQLVMHVVVSPYFEVWFNFRKILATTRLGLQEHFDSDTAFLCGRTQGYCAGKYSLISWHSGPTGLRSSYRSPGADAPGPRRR